MKNTFKILITGFIFLSAVSGAKAESALSQLQGAGVSASASFDGSRAILPSRVDDSASVSAASSAKAASVAPAAEAESKASPFETARGMLKMTKPFVLIGTAGALAGYFFACGPLAGAAIAIGVFFFLTVI